MCSSVRPVLSRGSHVKTRFHLDPCSARGAGHIVFRSCIRKTSTCLHNIFPPRGCLAPCACGHLLPVASTFQQGCWQWDEDLWTKLPDKSTTYSLSLVKHIIGAAYVQKGRPGKPPAPARVAPLAPSPPALAASVSPEKALPQATLVTVDADLAGQRLDNF